MKNPGLREDLWAVLDGRLWHATSPAGWQGIVTNAAISAFKHRRYRGAFSDRLGGVSLFDFGPTAKDEWGQIDNWAAWLGHEQKSRVAIWLEIDRRLVAPALIDAGSMLAAWHAGRDKPRIIPGVEACHRGDVPLLAVVGALLIGRDHGHPFQRVALNALDVARFEEALAPEPIESPILTAIRGSFR